MKVLIAALALASSPAWAEWSLVTTTPTSRVLVNSAARVHEGRPALWVRFERIDGADSQVSLVEFDCTRRAYRRMQSTTYDSKGAVTARLAEAEAWVVASPVAVANDLLRVACP